MKLVDTIMTPGGKLLVLLGLLMLLVSVALIMHMTGHDPQESGRVLIVTFISSVFTAIMAVLTGKEKPPSI